MIFGVACAILFGLGALGPLIGMMVRDYVFTIRVAYATDRPYEETRKLLTQHGAHRVSVKGKLIRR